MGPHDLLHDEAGVDAVDVPDEAARSYATMRYGECSKIADSFSFARTSERAVVCSAVVSRDWISTAIT
jgi:hypothetical protein